MIANLSYLWKSDRGANLSDRGPVREKRRSLSPSRSRPIVGSMKLQDGSSIVADLTTIGRKTGERRTVELRFTYNQGCFYASSSKVKGKHWCQNMLKNTAVELNTQGERLSCTATEVTDDKLRRHILTLRDSPPRMERVVFEIKPIS
jgi:deazaflavin-dependent oxidoreductase (nitroreductase family)